MLYTAGPYTVTNIVIQLFCHLDLEIFTTLLKNLSYHLFARNVPWTRMNCLITDQSPTSLFYQK